MNNRLNIENEVLNYANIDAAELMKLKVLPADVYIKIRDKFIKVFNRGDQVEIERIERYRDKNRKGDLFFVDENIHEQFAGVKFLPVRVNTLAYNKPIPFPTYRDKDGVIEAYLDRDQIYTKDHAQVLLGRKVKQIYIRESDEKLYESYLDESLENVIGSEAPVDDKANALFTASKKMLEEVYQKFDQKSMEKISRISKNINKFIKDNSFEGLKVLMKDVGKGKLHELAFKSATLSLSIIDYIHNNHDNPDAKVVSQHIDSGDLSREIIVMASLLQDIGVKYNHAAELNQHTAIGAYMIASSSDSLLHKKVAQVVAQHEEFCDGTGKPDGLNKPQLSPYAQILSVAQSYNRIRYQYNLSNLGTVKALKASGAKFNKYMVNIIEKVVSD